MRGAVINTEDIGQEVPTTTITSIQQEYDQAPPSQKEFIIPNGVYEEELVFNKPGTKIIGSGNTRITGRVFIAANNITLENLRIAEGTNKSPDYWGTVWSDGVDEVTIRKCHVSLGEWGGIALKGGAGHTIDQTVCENNGVLGLRLESLDFTLITNCTLRNNNTRQLNPGWEAGGMKATGNYGGIRNVLVMENHVHDNYGPGIWFDVDAENITIMRNRVHGNNNAGIIYELSQNGNIYNNDVFFNGVEENAWGFGAGILIQNSRMTSVRKNTLAWNGDGIILISQNRTEERWNDVSNVVFEENVVGHTDGDDYNTFAGAVLEDWEGIAVELSSFNRFINNKYFYSRNQESLLRHRFGANYWDKPSGPFTGTTITKQELDVLLESKGIPTV